MSVRIEVSGDDIVCDGRIVGKLFGGDAIGFTFRDLVDDALAVDQQSLEEAHDEAFSEAEKEHAAELQEAADRGDEREAECEKLAEELVAIDNAGGAEGRMAELREELAAVKARHVELICALRDTRKALAAATAPKTRKRK